MNRLMALYLDFTLKVGSAVNGLSTCCDQGCCYNVLKKEESLRANYESRGVVLLAPFEGVKDSRLLFEDQVECAYNEIKFAIGSVLKCFTGEISAFVI